RLPASSEFVVSAADKTFSVTAVGFKRRVLYAPLKKRDLRIGNYLYLKLAGELPSGATVSVINPSHKVWPATREFTAKFDPLRWSPAIHVNQTGYLPGQTKKAMVGYYLGSLGEMGLEEKSVFKIILADSEREVFAGVLVSRRDSGFPSSSYQRV